MFLLFSVTRDSSLGCVPTEGSISFTQDLSAWLSSSLTAGLNLTSSQAHTSQMMLASIRRPSEKEGFRWMLPLWSSSASWHTCVPSMSSTARSCTLYMPCGDPAVSQGRPCPDDQGYRCLKPLAFGLLGWIWVQIPSSPIARVRTVDPLFAVAVNVGTRASLALGHYPSCSS